MAVKIGSRSKQTKQGGGSDIPVQKPGMKPARLVQALYVGEQIKMDYNKQTRQWSPTDRWEDIFVFVFECPQDRIELNGESKPRFSSRTCVVSDYELSNFWKISKALDPSYDPETSDVFDLIGKSCMITIVHTKTGKAKIADVNPPLEGFTVPELESDPLTFNIDEPDMEVWPKMMAWTKTMVKESRYYKGSDLEKMVNQLEAQASEANSSDGESFDDDIPF